MAKILPENLNTPYCKFCKAPMPVYAFTWDAEGAFHGICFCKRCETLQWRVLGVAEVMAEVLAAQNGKKPEPEENGNGHYGNYL
jgi:hypothetical protein